MTGNHLSDLGRIIERLDQLGRLVRVKSEVDPVHELAGIAAKLEGGPSAVLFENVKGFDHPVFTGLYWSRQLIADLMDKKEHDLPSVISGYIKSWQANPVHPSVGKTGPVLEVHENEVDLTKLPIPTHAEQDGGPYFDAAVVIVKDPETGVRNASIQRFQVVGKDRLHVNIDAGRHLELYLEKAAARGENLPFTLNIGVGPGLHFAASTPSSAAPADTDELGIASEFEGAPVALVAGIHSEVEMAANAMYALEGELIAGELADEGPFAEVTGYYAKREPRQVARIKAVHRRKNPIYQTILSGVEVWNSIGLLGEANVLGLLQQQVPGVRDVYFSHGGCGAFAIFVRLRDMEGVAGRAVPGEFGQNRRAAIKGVLFRFEDQDAGALAHYEPVAILVERPRRPGRVSVVVGQCLGGWKAGGG